MSDATDSDDATSAPPETVRDQASVLLRDGGISAGLVALLVLLRIMAVSDWNWHTASSVTETIDLGDIAMIALGTLFEQPVLTGLVVTVLLPLTLLRLARTRHSSHEERIPLLLFALAQAAIVLSLVTTEGQWWVLLGTVVLAGLLSLGRRLGRRAEEPRVVARILRSLALIAVGLTLLLAAVVPTPWVPHERIRTTSGVVEGYVLEDASGTLKVLVSGRHQLEIITAGEVVSRTITDD